MLTEKNKYFIDILKGKFKEKLKSFSDSELNIRCDIQTMEEYSIISTMPFSTKELSTMYKSEIRRRKLKKLKY